MELYDWQKPHANKLEEALRAGGVAVDGSDTGVGKTVCAVEVAKRGGGKVFVVCPKAVIPSWTRTFDAFGITPVGVVNYEKLKMGNTPFGHWERQKWVWTLPEGTLIIWDEARRCKATNSQNAKMLRDSVGYPTRLIVRLLYACGLRVSEPLNLRIKDIDIDNSRLTIREAKRNKDRVVSLPCSLLPEIQEQIKRARKFYELDAVDKIPVPLPGLLAKKYPSAPYAWQWYWLFPSAKTCAHPRTGETVRWRVHEANVQKCVRESARKAGLDGAVTPHNLRHSYASHLIERGVNIKSLAEAMGHSSILTTSGYCHTDALSVPSPLSSLSVLGPVSGG